MTRLYDANEVESITSFSGYSSSTDEKEKKEMARVKKNELEINIAGLDIGSANCKDNTGITFESKTGEDYNPIGESRAVILNGEKFTYGKGVYCNTKDAKFKEPNFDKLLVTLLAMNSPLENHKIALGLPIGQYDKYKDDLRTYVLQNKEHRIKIGNQEERTIRILDVEVMPEGMGVLYSLKDEDFEEIGHKRKCLIVEIGGKTTDTVLLSQGEYEDREIETFSTITDTGTMQIYNKLQPIIEKRMGATCKLETAKLVAEDKLDMYDSETGEVVDFSTDIESILDELYNTIVSSLRHKYPEIATYKILLCGGGAELYEERFKKEFKKNVMVNTDLNANAKGFHVYAKEVFA